MDTSDTEGLGFSLAIYVAAIACVFVLIAVPVYWANGPTVYDNPPLARSGPLMNGPIVGRQISSAVPLVMLKRQTIVDPAILAGLNAKAEKSAKPRHTTKVAPRSSGTPVADLQPDRTRRSFFPFSLF